MNEERAKDVIAKVFFDTLEENLSKADIAFKAYERGYADAKKDIREGLEKLVVNLSTNEFNSAVMHDFYSNLKTIIEGEKVDI